VKADKKNLEKIVLAIERNKETPRQVVLAAKIHAEKVQERVAVITRNAKKMHTDALEAKLHTSRSYRGP
jgi:hypothetical protein